MGCSSGIPVVKKYRRLELKWYSVACWDVVFPVVQTMDFWCVLMWYANMHCAFLFSVCCVCACVYCLFFLFFKTVKLWCGLTLYADTVWQVLHIFLVFLWFWTAVSLSTDSHGIRKWVSVTAMVYTCMQLHKHNFQPKLPPTQPLILAKSVSSHLSVHFHTKHK